MNPPKTEPRKIHYREEWLHRAVDALRPLFVEKGYRIPDEVHVSVGWPSTGGRSGKGGEAWETSTSEDGKAHVFVSPLIGDEINVLGELTHLMGHVATTTKHTAAFVRWMSAFGMEGLPSEALPGTELKTRLAEIVETLGKYPHAKITPHEHSKQGTRLLKVICPDCGYVIRVTRKWLDEGTPTCPCNGLMVEADEEGNADDPLNTTNATHEFTAHDGRFKCVYMKRMDKGNIREQRWLVTDWEADDGRGRVTPLATREDVIAFMAAVIEGVYKYEARELPTPEPDAMPDAEYFAEVDPDEPDEDLLNYLGPDELEDTDDDLEPDTTMRLRRGGEWVDVPAVQDPVQRGAGVDDQGEPVELLP